jgi:hypothetical protein
MEKEGSKVIMRTFSPYFSPNNILAPAFSASAIGIFLSSFLVMFSLIFWLTRDSTSAISSSVILEK